jgi:hypothetical protein
MYVRVSFNTIIYYILRTLSTGRRSREHVLLEGDRDLEQSSP